MMFFSFRTLAFAWTGVAGAAAVSAAALQASYAPPPAVQQPVAAASTEPAPPVAAAPTPVVPFENRSLLAMLPPPDIRPRPSPHAAEPRVSEPLPLPPIPPMRVARVEPRHAAPARSYAREPVYAAEPSYPSWAWRGRLPYPGQYAVGRAYYYGGQPSYYGWQPEY